MKNKLPIRYDTEFKAKALAKLAMGLSARKVSQQLGISQITLKRWRQASQMDRITFVSYKQANTENQSDTDGLTLQIQRLEEEKHILKEALRILLRAQ